ncbi:PAS domain S-box-containing protein [Ruminococcaceae bacterium YRB3002]|nr:PAS domain S-box-containing protein [Ruminococcaceae bacterium YRB3002]
MSYESPRQMNEQELVASFSDAVRFGHLYVLYQPKINHTTGRMIGAEALMRWKHPIYGVQMPLDFIPVLEKNNLILDADLFVCESVCRFLRRCLDEDIPAVPISINMSRYDIFNHDYVNMIEQMRKKYDIPVKYIHIEVTESSAIGGMELMTRALNQMHEYGYVVEMDDFGSGYSSLNILKDLDVDVIKLDMRFLSGDIGGRGGAILSSIVQMTKWLNTPVLAEGVETPEQAEFMKSIGCYYIQGYLYSKPLNDEEFIEKLKIVDHEPLSKSTDLIYSINSGRFWDPQSMETLLFNELVGPAAIFTYKDGKTEFVRVNAKYIKEIGMNLTAREMLGMDLLDSLDDDGKKDLVGTLERAIATGEEEECEVWRNVCSQICGEEKVLIRGHVRMIGHADDRYLFYAMVQNITADRRRYEALEESERKFRMASEQNNTYAWEYEISTHRMRPCFRCMRDLGVPPVVEDYPQPLFDNGLFPPDYYDMYMDWMKQLENGVDHLEAIIPLTPDRIPFIVRYTTEFDENGCPLKAYGSATIVVDDMADK